MQKQFTVFLIYFGGTELRKGRPAFERRISTSELGINPMVFICFSIFSLYPEMSLEASPVKSFHESKLRKKIRSKARLTTVYLSRLGISSSYRDLELLLWFKIAMKEIEWTWLNTE